jgi:hypothetical protein
LRHKTRQSDDISELPSLKRAKRRIRVINYVLERAGRKIGSVMMDGFSGPVFVSLDYDIGMLRIIWREHLAWLEAIGLRGVGPNDLTSIPDRFDEGNDGNGDLK